MKSRQFSARFATIFGSKSTGRRAIWDTIVGETDRFVAIPSKGSLVPGWLLIVPKRHVLSCAALSREERRELHFFKDHLAERVCSVFGPVTFFEHGPSHSGSPFGCGLDHAHLHLVPLPFDVLQAAQGMSHERIVWKHLLPNAEAYDYVSPDQNYILIVAPYGRTAVATDVPVESQWLRRVIASHLGMCDQWDYQAHPFTKNVALTLRALRFLGNRDPVQVDGGAA